MGGGRPIRVETSYEHKDDVAKFGGRPVNIGTRESPVWRTQFPNQKAYDDYQAYVKNKQSSVPRSTKPHKATFYKLNTGDWGARVTTPNPQPGDQVEIERKDGTKQMKKIRRVIARFKDGNSLIEFE